VRLKKWLSEFERTALAPSLLFSQIVVSADIRRHKNQQPKYYLMNPTRLVSNLLRRRILCSCALATIAFLQAAPVMADDPGNVEDGVTINVSPSGAGPVLSFFDVFVDITPQSGPSVGTWFEVPYQGQASPQLDFVNGQSSPITLSDAGYYLSPTQIPLDQLNSTDLQPLPGSYGASIGAGDSLLDPSPLSVPDQFSTLALFSVVSAGLLACRRMLPAKLL